MHSTSTVSGAAPCRSGNAGHSPGTVLSLLSPDVRSVLVVRLRVGLGDLLCSLAGGSNITSLGQLRSLLSSLGVNLTDGQIQSLLTQLGIGDLTAGLSQVQIQQILALLGLGSALPA